MSDTHNFDSLQFTETNGRVIERRLNAFYEALRRASGETDYQIAQDLPMVQEQGTLAAALTGVNVDIDQTAKQSNLLWFANGQNLDAIAYLYGSRGDRLTANFALTTLQYNLQAPRGVDTIIPARSRVTADNQIFFATLQPLLIKAGDVTGTVTAQANIAGNVGNNYDIGNLNRMVDLIPFVVSVTNITAPTGGGDSEQDEAYRNRIRQIPESFSVAGPDGAYEFWALSTDPNILDAKAYMPELDLTVLQGLLWDFLEAYRNYEDMPKEVAQEFYDKMGQAIKKSGTGPGNVNVAILMQGGQLPSQEILDKVMANLTDPINEKRPLTDFVHIISPEVVPYTINIDYKVTEESDSERVHNNILTAVQMFVNYQKSKLGIELNNSLLRDYLTQAGAYWVDVISPQLKTLQPYQFAVLEGSPIINGVQEGSIKG
jgi:phage-related baseplate assembly protein